MKHAKDLSEKEIEILLQDIETSLRQVYEKHKKNNNLCITCFVNAAETLVEILKTETHKEAIMELGANVPGNAVQH